MKSPRRFQRSQARNAGKAPGIARSADDAVGMRLNKYLAHSGVASRRNAGDMVKEGAVTVNGALEINPAYQVREGDEISFKGQPVSPSSTLVYVLLNKPRNVITTTKDERGRADVISLLDDEAINHLRLFPVGRLDRETTGLLLITNDGDTAKRLTHPKHEVSKIYQATLDKPFREEDLAKLKEGLELEDGPAAVDWASFPNREDQNVVALEIHIGRNRIVRRMFAHLGYTVEKLDRTYFAGLNKKDLPRGFYRYLTETEIRNLRHFS